MDLDTVRTKISEIDHKIVSCLNERANLSILVGESKRKSDSSIASSTSIVYVPEQEKNVFNRVKSLNEGPLTNDSVCSIYREIMSASISLQEFIKVGYLGPQGTFCHQAAKERFGNSMTYIPINTIDGIFTSLSKGEVNYGLVPVENIIFGSVVQTLDSFKSPTNDSVSVLSEVYLPLKQSLLSNSKLEHINKIFSHPMAIGQAKDWLKSNLPKAEIVEVNSTALGAQLASKEPNSAAISNSICADIYGLSILEMDISSKSNNVTRFFVIGAQNDKMIVKKADKMLVMFTVDHRNPGALCLALNVFSKFGLNLTAINSRPANDSAFTSLDSRRWHYMFFVEATITSTESYDNCNQIADDVISELRNSCSYAKLLGIYPNMI
ncbi:P-protein [Smittium culicis]|uniref:Bifunctional chorismate mutase/prephenate dehydratase n=1 Tax=Smittium culicis TaxID=133412 RepID=A0A1R1XKM4_9FUNG|nr:P-protein [Smittium culicis]